MNFAYLQWLWVFFVWVRLHEAGGVFMNTCSLLLCFHPKPSFSMHEGYVLWVVKLQILCIMFKCSCILDHLQLYDTTHVMILE